VTNPASLRTPANLLLTAAGAGVIAFGVWILWTFDPNAPNNRFPPCLFRMFTGLHCIGCGLTRALHALAHGDVGGALAMNPLAVLVLPLLPLMVLHGRGWRPGALAPLMRLVMEPRMWLVLLPAYWVARNLPCWPFTWLAPG
jgi:Protein of unknown function (DUF2752)